MTEGYVYEMKDDELFIIYLDESDVDDLDEAELNQLLIEGASNSQGDYFKIPFTNELIGTDFTKGDKVRIYWDGGMFLSSPGKADGVSLIIKLGK